MPQHHMHIDFLPQTFDQGSQICDTLWNSSNILSINADTYRLFVTYASNKSQFQPTPISATHRI
ncbi:hypothetical protein CANCADRAFT_31995, partial [Tortispora caseinolytica NRRL Y-17796]